MTTAAQPAEPVEAAIEYALKLSGVPYGWWRGGDIPKKAPMWAEDGPAPAPEMVESCNCAGLTNLMLRSVGQPLPSHKDNGCGGTGAYGAVYASVWQSFDLETIYPRGTLLLRKYRSVEDQGHVAVVLEPAGRDAKVLQSHCAGFPSTSPGVNATYTVAESHCGGYYEFAVLPTDWLQPARSGQPASA
ncbi:unnamed protein product [Symbiodinium natans]|uniref:Peptidase C51 domain-containing protein n=1 Tax=Symbiodinium natans TaxID=878477 RepID=A0A812SW49_9DINO|nr:unnamed protein product [Symbiodinium natans]